MAPDDTPPSLTLQFESSQGGVWFAIALSTMVFSPYGGGVEMQNTGDPALRVEVVATVEHVLADRPGDWRVSIIGSQANDRWEMKIFGPNGLERSYTLEGSLGEHRPEVIRVLLRKLVPR